MSDEQHDRLLKACKPAAMIALQCGSPRSPQENANDVWRALGEEMGFKWDTARPCPGEGPKVFTAEPIHKDTISASGILQLWRADGTPIEIDLVQAGMLP